MSDTIRDEAGRRVAPHNYIETTLDDYFRDISPQLTYRLRAGDLRISSITVDEGRRMVIILSDDKDYTLETASSFKEVQQIISNCAGGEPGGSLFIGNGSVKHNRPRYGDSFGSEATSCPVCEARDAEAAELEEEKV